MTGTLLFGCATGIAFVLWFYAASLLRQLYLGFRVDARVEPIGARPDLAGSGSAKFSRRLHAYATNDNFPVPPLASTGTDAPSTAQ
jgi:hypothetical protein